MPRTIMLIPTGTNVGLTGVTLGLIHAMECQGIMLGVFKPVAQPTREQNQQDQTITILRENSAIPVMEPLAMSKVEALLSSGQEDMLMEKIVGALEKNKQEADIIIVEGIIPTSAYPFADALNYKIAKTLGAEIVFVTAMGSDTTKQLAERIEIARNNFGGLRNEKIIGVIVNKINAPLNEMALTHSDIMEIHQTPTLKKKITTSELSKAMPVPLLGAIPWNIDLSACRAIDIAKLLDAKIINEGDIKNRRIKHVSFCARSMTSIVPFLCPDVLLVTSADRAEVLVSAALATMNGVKIGAILLIGGFEIEKPIADLCKEAFASGVPVFTVDTNGWQTSLKLHNFNLEIPADDKERIKLIENVVADHLNKDWINSLTKVIASEPRLSPPAFRYRLTELARHAHKTIVLPEGDEPRTIKAAAICAERNIANCILLGNPKVVKQIAKREGITLGNGIKIVDPDKIRTNYIASLVELRKEKGMTPLLAQEQLADNVVLGTMMLAQGQVDGLVSGAVHTTANTIRPPLQLIKTAPGNSLVSSVFFMLMPEQVYIYGDCAINPNPTAVELAEIAIQSADTAIAFGIDPRVAMISYSTGNSGQGKDVEKVKEATRIAKEKRPDIKLDGPLQYDTSVIPEVAQTKAPNSEVAGKANVFIFPDLNTGNTTYKAVQRSANLVSIGPMLQGMRKPVNDLSRGALVDDIVYTIALTAIQATESNEVKEKMQS